MKNILLLAAIAALSVSSCTKDDCADCATCTTITTTTNPRRGTKAVNIYCNERPQEGRYFTATQTGDTTFYDTSCY